MKIALLPSTQWSNPVLGGGSEAQYAQDVANRLKPLLEKAGHKVFIGAGKQDANSDGAKAAVAWGPQLSLAIHSDAGYYPSSHHASLMCYQEKRSVPWATAVLNGFCRRMNFTSRGLQVRTPGVNGVAVLRIPETVCPSCLIEMTWHDRNPDAAELRTPEWRQKAAEALCGAISDYAGGSTPEEDEEMAAVSNDYGPTNDPVYTPGWLAPGKPLWIDVTNYGASTIGGRISLKRDNGDMASPVAFTVPAETTWRCEVGSLFKASNVGGVTVKVERLDGPPMLVTRTQVV